MKNFNYLLVMILSVTVSVSCSDDYDDDNFNDNISYSSNEYDDDNVSYRALVGTWEGAEFEDDVRIIKTVTFNEDLSGWIVSSETFEGETVYESQSFTWSIDENKLIFTFEREETEIFSYSVRGPELITFSNNAIFHFFAKHKTW
jgi:hypothetical protein